MTKRWGRPPLPAVMSAEARLLAELAPRLDRLADDAWVLAQRTPALAADPVLVAEARRLLAPLRHLLRHQPGHRALPVKFPPGIGLHALALLLRQLQEATARLVARCATAPDTAGEIDAVNHITALVLHDIAADVAKRRDLVVPGIPAPAKKLIPAPPDAT